MSPFCKQFAQFAPSVPHDKPVRPCSHKPELSQQPFGHVVAEHTPASTPNMHCWPTHCSPNAGEQIWQKSLKLPHAAFTEPAWHVSDMSQQPNGHVCWLHLGTGKEHCWLLHCWPNCAQFWHVLPKSPHCVSTNPVWQLPNASQHPLKHVCELHRPASKGAKHC